MLENKSKHENYEILNLIGYGLSKFNDDFIKQFGFTNKNNFYKYFVDIGIVKTGSVIKNRMDLFDPFFPDNGRRGWWQKGNAYIHRKLLIDSLFGNEVVVDYANIVKLFLIDKYNIKEIHVEAKPIVKSKFRKLQETGLEAEIYFINNFNSISAFQNGILEDARLFGDGYDFQVTVNENTFLAEIKGIREKKGKFRMTEKEYNKALEYKNDYIITLVLNMNELPTFLPIENPAHKLKFKREEYASKPIIEYLLLDDIC
jgi:hypothetical protein